MTFGTILDSRDFRHDLMCYENRITDLSVALNASHFGEMRCLVRQPVVTLHHNNLFPVTQHRKACEIGMTTQTHVVVVQEWPLAGHRHFA